MQNSFHGLRVALVQLMAPCSMHLSQLETCPDTGIEKDSYQLTFLLLAILIFSSVTFSLVEREVLLMDRFLMMHEGPP
jgi:hypothetical protein